MEETFRGNVAICIEDLGHSRKLLRVVDTDTGEILLKKYECEKIELFPDGYNAVIREMMFSREILPNGAEMIYVSHPDRPELLYFTKILSSEEKRFGQKKGTGKGRGRTRGKEKSLSISETSYQKLQTLDDASLGFLLRLGTLARHDTGLIAKRGKPMQQDDIFTALNATERTGKRRLADLIQIGVIEKTEEGYFLSKNMVQKR